MSEARNLRNMTMAQTPLLGDENTPLHANSDGGTGFESATPRHQAAFTPNPLATPRTDGQNGDVPATPRDGAVGATPLRTPRDSLKINPATGMPVGETPREHRLRDNSAKRALQAGFMSLPKPENNFELLVPDEEEDNEAEGGTIIEEDAAERDARIKRMQEEEERKALARRSQVVRLGLPRPARVELDVLLRNLDIGENEDEDVDARKLIDQELGQLILHDSIAHPLPGTNLPGGTVSTYLIPPDEYVATARDLVHQELAGSVGAPGANEEQVKEGLAALLKNEEIDESQSWAHTRRQLAFNAETRTWVDPDSMSLEERIAGYSAVLAEHRAQMTKEANKVSKVEKKLNITLGGYQVRSKALVKRVTDAFDELAHDQVDYESFARLGASESAAGPRRVSALKEEVEVLERREQRLQERYAELDRERRDAEARITALEEKIMLEAEALNEAALAEMDEQ